MRSRCIEQPVANIRLSMTWSPSASIELIRARAKLYQRIRHFFAERAVMEVDVPVLSAATITDPYIDSIHAEVMGQTRFLQTSPEFFMKRLLASGSGDIFSLGKAFRNGEAGRRHNPEFTMLEWYRVGWDDSKLMQEVAALIRTCLKIESVQFISYRDLFLRELQLDPHQSTLSELRQVARQYLDVPYEDADRDMWLDLLMANVIEPTLGTGLVFVFDFPASQAALARIQMDSTGEPVAKRFEAYLNSMELVNGYWELTDGDEQTRRFMADQQKRTQLGLPNHPVDQHLLKALQAGMPSCAGVALGVDRLLMALHQCQDIREVLAFSHAKA